MFAVDPRQQSFLTVDPRQRSFLKNINRTSKPKATLVSFVVIFLLFFSDLSWLITFKTHQLKKMARLVLLSARIA
ncbi:hypothetical protein HRI_003582200 [Hibiscus trionum]|uniref:Uncharacterized protein n=1 Tax=Hibiscus trionum TaxID=183268 RepID=A0A9W7IN45_HIBTR|nr:hypothetical protein HRI_003582200 [Hibiscus trionum]